MIQESAHGCGSLSREGTFQTGALTADPLKKSDQMTFWDMPNATFSVELADGHLPSRTLGLVSGEVFGQAHVPASHSVPQGNAEALVTVDTSGLCSIRSSRSAALSMSLGNRLQEQLGSTGSMGYVQTWRLKTTPLGRSYWEHIASAHRTSDKDCGGWPTPDTCAGGTGPSQKDRNSMRLQDAVKEWCGWTTPNARDWKDSASPEALMRAMDSEAGSPNLPRQVAGLVNGLSAGTENSDSFRLNPAFSRWLMGFPNQWCDCAVTAMQSFPKSRKRSSKPTSNVLPNPDPL
jgi:hypothetical protein